MDKSKEIYFVQLEATASVGGSAWPLAIHRALSARLCVTEGQNRLSGPLRVGQGLGATYVDWT